VRGVKNGPSPAWLQSRLKAVGLRPINALVDVTNYLSQDRGRPLHVYDADKLEGAVRARLGKAGETFLGLDGKEHGVDAAMCVIADDAGPLGLGGVIGGEASGATEATVNVLIEAPISIRSAPPRRTQKRPRHGCALSLRARRRSGVRRHRLDLATDMILKLPAASPPSQGRGQGAGRPGASSPSISRAWRSSSGRS
jgi:phenylalanyl-tRNA synthetase beta chain